MTAPPLPPELRDWPRADVERFCEVSGRHLSDGLHHTLADRLALQEMRAARRKERRG